MPRQQFPQRAAERRADDVSHRQRRQPEQVVEGAAQVTPQHGEQHDDHAFAQLWRRPNPWYGGGTLRSAVGFDYTMHGNAYVEKDRGTGRAVTGLVYQPSWQVHPKGSSTELITHYEIATSTGTRIVPREDMIHFRDGIDPHDQRAGLSRLQSLLREIYTDDEAANMTASILRNLGVPGVVISPTSQDDELDEPARDRIKSYFKRMFRGDQAGNALVIGRSVKIDTLDIDLARLNIDKLRQIPEERVCAVIGVPAAVVGFGSGLEQTKVGATMKELREMGYENVIIPMQRVAAEELDRSLLPEFETDPAWSVEIDNTNVRVLQEDENRKSGENEENGRIKEHIYQIGLDLMQCSYQGNKIERIISLDSRDMNVILELAGKSHKDISLTCRSGELSFS